MTPEVFKTQMRKLATAYSKQLTEAQISLYWDYFKDVEDGKFIESVTDWIREKGSFPLINEIQNFLRRRW